MVKKRKSSTTTRGIHLRSAYIAEFEALTQRLRKNILRLRLERGLTQEQMQDFELSLRQFQRIESGETVNVTLSNLFKIAKALHVEIRDLVE